MSDRKLYSLSEREAAVLRARDPRWTDSAQRATPDPLTPIDTDAAVERMCKAYYEGCSDALDDTIRPRWDRLVEVSPDIAQVYRAHIREALDVLLEEPGGH